MSLRPVPIGFLMFAAILSAASRTPAQVPTSETYFPATARLYISVPNPEHARKRFDATQLGELVNHPAMEKFNASLDKQLEGQGRLAERLGVALGDLEKIAGGEVAMAVIRPEGEADGYATALVIDVAGAPREDVVAFLKSIEERRIKSGGAGVKHVHAGRRGIEYKMPKRDKQPAFSTFVLTTPMQPLLIVADHEKETHAIYDRITGKRADALGKLPAFAGPMNQVAKASPGLSPDVRWFVDPFGYMRLRRDEQIDAGTRTEMPGKEDLDIYAEEGFDAIQGIGGWLMFDEGGHELLHRSFAYAPAVDRSAKDKLTLWRLDIEKAATPAEVRYAGPENNKYFLSARVMNFLNKQPMLPIDWIPADLGTHLTLNMPLQRAFKYSETLVNGLAREAGGTYWADTLNSIRDDKDGPRVDIRKDIAAQLGERVIYITDNVDPADPQGERTAIALEISGNVAAVSKALDEMNANDPDAKLHEVDGHKVWELVQPPEDRERRRGGRGGRAGRDGRGGADDERLPDSAFAVAHGYLIRGSHVDIVKRLLKAPAKKDSLAEALDQIKVHRALDKLTDGKESFRYFDRLDRSVEGHWELTRMNKFPQSESMLANWVAQMQGLDPEDPETRKRKQDIDGTHLPGFAFAKDFLGPSGMFIKSVPEGWLVTGVVLTKEK